MKLQRGKIIRDASVGLGIVSSEGTNLEFDLMRCWLGDTPPRVNMVVELVLTEQGEIQLLKPVGPVVLGREQAEKLAVQAQVLASKGMVHTRALSSKLTSKTGLAPLVLLSLIGATWVFLPMIEINLMGWSGNQSLSFTEFTQVLNSNKDNFIGYYSGNSSGGLWLALLVLGLIGVPVASIFKPAWTRAVGALPLMLMLAFAGLFYLKVRDYVHQAAVQLRGGFGFGGQSMRDALEKMMERAMESYSLEYGFYLGLMLCTALWISTWLKHPAPSNSNAN